AWFEKSASPAFYHVVAKRDGCGAAGLNYQIARDPSGLLFASDGGVVRTADVPDGAWTHVAATYDPAAHVVKLYANGAEVASASGYTLAGANGGPLRIGASGTCPDHFPGNIDDVRIYRRVLSAAEIAALNPFPAVSSFAPRSGLTGSTVTIEGS